MWWLFVIIVCGIIALFKFDLYLQKLINKQPFIQSPIQARRRLFNNYVRRLRAWCKECVKNFWFWCKQRIKIYWEFAKRNPVIFTISAVFVILFCVFALLFFVWLSPIVKQLYMAVEGQVNDKIRIGSKAFRNASLSVAGSITLSIALLGVILTAIRSILTRQQNRTDEERLVTEQISRAIDQTGAYNQNASGKKDEPNIEIRLGGLYSLQRIMQDSARDMLPIARILYAYVRENIKRDRVKRDEVKEHSREFVPLLEDIASALNIIHQFNKEWNEKYKEPPDDSQLNFSRADFSKYSFKGMDFSNFTFEYANLSHADFSYANLSGAKLTGANLEGADLSNTDLRDADLSNTNLSNAFLMHADLDNADLERANLSAAILSRAGLHNANLSNANLEDADLSESFLPDTDFSFANLKDAVLEQAYLFGANLKNANLERADLSETDLSYADLSDAYLRDADLACAELKGAKFHHGILFDDHLSGADLSSADLSESIGLTQSKINQAKGNEETKLPEGLIAPKSWTEENE